MRHILVSKIGHGSRLFLEHALCQLDGPIGEATHVLFDSGDASCPDCLRSAIAKVELCAQDLRAQLAKVDALS